MKKALVLLAAMVMVFGLSMGAFAAPYVETIEFPTGYFVPDESNTYSSPYYRWYNEDWGWQHTAVDPTGATTATLWISAWDVDTASSDPEVDNIYLGTSTSGILLGSLAGLDDDWGYTTFNLDLTNAAVVAAINGGLQVFMDIDSTHIYDNWAVTLAKSVLTLDEGTPPGPGPGPVPEPATLILLGIGLAGMATLRKKF